MSRAQQERQRLADLMEHAEAQLIRSSILWREAHDLGRGGRRAVTRPGASRQSPFARLLARRATMPIIEQAKGILIAQSACDDVLAFDLLRQASQRLNVPVRDLAAQIVARAAEPAARRARAEQQADV